MEILEEEIGKKGKVWVMKRMSRRSTHGASALLLK
jgi:hypothetical protein